MTFYISVFSLAHTKAYSFLWDYRTFGRLHSPFGLVVNPHDLHTGAYPFLCRVYLHQYLRHPLALSHLIRSSLCRFSFIFNTNHTLYDRSRLCHFSYVLGDFGHCDHAPYVSGDFGHGDRVLSFLCFRWFQSLRSHPICFRWFRSWRLHPVFLMFQVILVIVTASHMFQVILVMAIVSRSLYVSGDSGHGDRVPSFLCFRWFRSWWARPLFFML